MTAFAARPVKVLLIAPNTGVYGGIEAFMLAIDKAVRADPGIIVKVCFKRTRNFEIRPELTAALGDSGTVCSFVDRASRGLLKAIRWSDLVHLQTPSLDVAAGSKCLGRPLVMTLHNWRRPRSGLRARSNDLAVLLADRHWYNSEFVWNSWEARRRRRHSEKLPVLSQLPSLEFPREERQGFIFVGRWIQNKGIEQLLEAYAAADIDRGAWPLTIVGDGPLRPDILKRIKNKGLQNVYTPGFVDSSSKDLLIAKARWLVAPSNTNEDLGLTPIEARNVGVPCIITRDGGLQEAGGTQALDCAPGDVNDLRRSLEKAARMSEHEYFERSVETKRELEDYLGSMVIYAERYRHLVRQCSSN